MNRPEHRIIFLMHYLKVVFDFSYDKRITSANHVK